MIPLALLDDDIPDTEKIDIADAILNHSEKFSSTHEFTHQIRKKVDVMDVLDFDSDKEEPPSMAKLVDDHSMFIFLALGINKAQLQDCFILPPMYWKTQSSFKAFQEFGRNLTVVNDHAERAVGKILKI